MWQAVEAKVRKIGIAKAKRKSRKQEEKKKKQRKRKDNIGKKGNRGIGDLEQKIKSREVRKRGQEIGFSKIPQVNLCFRKKVNERMLIRKM